MAFQVFSCIFLLFCFHSQIAHAIHQCKSRNNISSSPLEFLNQLSGVKKGHKAPKIHELKKIYLSYLGYMNYNNTQSRHHENTFDDPLEIALKKYLQFYNLNTTGVLDAKTTSKMRDFYNSNKSSILFHMGSYYEFFPDNAKWNKTKLSYSFDKNFQKKAKPGFQRALNEWESTKVFKFYEIKIFKQADIKISFMRGNHGDGLPFGGLSRALAHGFRPPDGRLHFDKDRSWCWKCNRRRFDFQTVALHELGHVLGLAHSIIFDAVMYHCINPGQVKSLHEDDIDGIKALYNFRGK